MNRSHVVALKRRRFVLGSLAAASGFPHLASATERPRYRRMSLADPHVQRTVRSYKIAVSRMLSLPPSHPCNWYRLAFTHLFDCPHQNWWFLPWHRGYLGWFEQICREFSGDPHFALPYWDWTAQPYIPKQMWEDSLNPGNVAYISTLNEFQEKFRAPMAEFWNSLSAVQKQFLLQQGFKSMDDVWTQISDADHPMFFELSAARALSSGSPCLDAVASGAVDLGQVHRYLRPEDFGGFAGAPSAHHGVGNHGGPLEIQAHGLVHKSIEGFMLRKLSPVDPIFYLHHANVDRLWDVWTRKQIKNHLPTLPNQADIRTWELEPFLFFVDEKGRGVAQNKAGAYASTQAFDYSYQRGSAEDESGHSFVNLVRLDTIPGTISQAHLELGKPAAGSVKLPESVLRDLKLFQPLVAKLTIDTLNSGASYAVFVNPPDGASSVSVNSPGYAGAVTAFGTHHAMSPIIFTVPLAGAIDKLRQANLLRPDAPLRLQVVMVNAGFALKPIAAILRYIAISSI